MTAGRIARELWWTNEDLSHVDIIPPWFFMPIYHLGDEQ
jgi:quinol-cytochrome oxidoreductase complex cytochrome b subunit